MSSAAFGFGGLTLIPAALAAVISPAPAESIAPTETLRAVTISAPLIWSGVYSGWRERISAAAAETTGEAKEVGGLHGTAGNLMHPHARAFPDIA